MHFLHLSNFSKTFLPFFRGRLIYQRFKNRTLGFTDELLTAVFASVFGSVLDGQPQKPLQAFGFYFTSVLPFGFFIPSVFRGLVLGIRFLRSSEDL